ncbi:hypothetical protein G5I_04387 [Acromyrmex echinatior]|uniref:Uncharacterized protein n=1 Tax=Acromyrmex echinatior TaxID=103372 RepID=F4WFH8_ACREC|nr:hypothetical protein G5I_04387 [Acromyrmex echinatior]
MMLDGMRLRITNGCFGYAIGKYISIKYTGDTSLVRINLEQLHFAKAAFAAVEKTRDPRDLLVARWRGTHYARRTPIEVGIEIPPRQISGGNKAAKVLSESQAAPNRGRPRKIREGIDYYRYRVAIMRTVSTTRETGRAPSTKSTDDDDGLASVYGSDSARPDAALESTKRLVTSLGTAAALYVIACTI